MMMMVRVFAILLLGVSLMLGAAAPAMAATVKVSVNGEDITDFQIAQRLKLFTLEGRNGAKAATAELVDEALKLQEAERLGFSVSEGDVDGAFLNVARNIKVSADKLKQILADSGVGAETLRARLKAGLAWGKVTDTTIMPRVQLSDLELDTKAAAELTASSSFDYILKEVIFVMPGGKGSASKRTAEANQYRRSFSGCDTAVELSLSYTDAAVIEVGRRHATQLPEAVAKELAGLNIGGISKPRVVQNGVSMLAICAKEEARDLTFVKGAMQQKEGGELLKTKVDEYLANLRSKADIQYR
jgi:peptidyl-prolyl cis-trans isomerase SurA